MRTPIRYPFALFVATMLLLFALGAQAQSSSDEILIDQGVHNPLPIAVTQFFGAGDDFDVGANISRVISSDLEGSGLFAPIGQAAFIQSPEDIAEGIP